MTTAPVVNEGRAPRSLAEAMEVLSGVGGRTDESLYRAQRRALFDTVAADECARRYAVGNVPIGYVADRVRYQARLIQAYLRGLYGEPDPYAGGRGGNFAAPWHSAYRAGARVRSEQLAEARQQ